ncbi:DUF3237 family protein [Streptomyces sp. NPDC096176]|uniref:DUF3237 family protein n=1 Tax=Streptomyces sp. NPDC096176 TaxID=3366079 RepID=UPI0037F6F8BB
MQGHVQQGDPDQRYQINPADYYFRTNPLFETGAEPYAWLNGTVCIGRDISSKAASPTRSPRPCDGASWRGYRRRGRRRPAVPAVEFRRRGSGRAVRRSPAAPSFDGQPGNEAHAVPPNAPLPTAVEGAGGRTWSSSPAPSPMPPQAHAHVDGSTKKVVIAAPGEHRGPAVLTPNCLIDPALLVVGGRPRG